MILIGSIRAEVGDILDLGWLALYIVRLLRRRNVPHSMCTSTGDTICNDSGTATRYSKSARVGMTVSGGTTSGLSVFLRYGTHSSHPSVKQYLFCTIHTLAQPIFVAQGSFELFHNVVWILYLLGTRSFTRVHASSCRNRKLVKARWMGCEWRTSFAESECP